MEGRLRGKVAAVTAGGRGAGRAVAQLLAAEGASVVVNDLGFDADGTGTSAAPADRVVSDIESAGGSAVANYDDVSDMEGGERLIETALDVFGRLDALVNAATVKVDKRIDEMAPQEFDHVVRLNVRGTFVPTKFAAVVFRKQRSGRIVSFTSDAGLGQPGSANYAASSEAIVGMTRSVARDLGKYGVTCNAVSVSGPSGPAARWAGPGEPDDPENAAPLAVLLCTESLPSVNGRVFGISGGDVHLYSEPTVERSIHKWGTFDLEDLDVLAPARLGPRS